MDDIKALKEALEAGPTPGEWKLFDEPPNDMWLAGRSIGAADPKDARRVCDAYSIISPPEPGSMHEANARYIAACSPARIARLLERLEAAERDAARYRKWQHVLQWQINPTRAATQAEIDEHVDKARVSSILCATEMKEPQQ